MGLLKSQTRPDSSNARWIEPWCCVFLLLESGRGWGFDILKDIYRLKTYLRAVKCSSLPVQTMKARVRMCSVNVSGTQ